MKLHKLAGLLLLVVCAACSEDTVTTDPIDLSQVGAADDFTDTRDDLPLDVSATFGFARLKFSF